MIGKKVYRYLLLICGLILISYYIYSERNIYLQNPFDRQLPLENPSYVTTDNYQNIYVIDRSMKRIIKMKPTGEVDFYIEGGKRDSESFYYCSELTVDQAGNVYALNRVLDFDGAFVEKEEIIRYNHDGKFDGVIFSKTYEEDNKPVREGRLTSLTYREDGLYCLYKNKNQVELYQISPGKGLVNSQKVFSMANLELMLVDVKVCQDMNKFAYSTKTGQIYTVQKGNQASLLYSANGENGLSGISIPWRLDISDCGSIYFADIGQRKIYQVNSSGVIDIISPQELQASGLKGDIGAFYYFDVSEDGSIYTINKNNVIQLGVDQQINFCSDSATYNMADTLYRIFAWLMVILWLVGIFTLCRFIYIDAMKRKLSRTTVQIIFIFIAVILSAGIVFHMLYQSLINRYEDKVFDNLSQTVQLAASVIDGDQLEKINRLDHFQNEDYQQVRSQLFKIFNNNQDQWNQGQYGVIYRVIDNVVYATMFYDDSIGTFYPIDFDYTNSKYFDVHHKGQIITQEDSDVDGDWMYALGPIYDGEGNIVGMVEVGTDLYGFVEENKRLIKNIILDVATVLVILIFVLIELTLLRAILSKRQQVRAGIDTDIARPLGFILLTATSFSTAFTPLLMKQLYKPIFGLPEGIVLGLPISAEMLFVAISSVVAGYMIDAKGWKPIFQGGMLILGAGTLLCGVTNDPIVFIAARAIVGAGIGLAMMSLEQFALSAPTEEAQNSSLSNLTSGVFTGINCGIVIGSMLAERIGYSNVFFVSAGFLAVAGLVAYKMVPNVRRLVSNSDDNAITPQINLVQFFADKSVLSFFLLIFIPASIASMFLMYFFPLFVESAQISPANIGRAFLLNGLCIIFLGPLLSKYAARYLGMWKSVLVYSLLMAGAMLIFASQGTVLAAFLAVILLGIADSFGITLLVGYYHSLPATNQLGGGKAMGYFNLVENFGQMLGPIVLGSVMILGVQKGIGFLGVGLCIMLILFVLLTGKFVRRNREQSNVSG